MKLSVPTMACGGCAATVEAAVKKLDASGTVEADLSARTVTVTSAQPPEAVAKAVAAAGYPATVL